MAKLYTRTGDDGTTGLFGGGRVPKDHPRVDAYGTVDELNAALGLCVSALSKPGQSVPGAPARVAFDLASDDLFRPILATLQSRLFDLGADLATPGASVHASKIHRMNEQHVKEAEGWIDRIDSGNAPMTQFILPGGTEFAACLHLARTISRRAERAMIRLSHAEAINPQALIYMNRVSDLLFAMARRANKEAGVADVAWRK